jgi:hypothetical protein
VGEGVEAYDPSARRSRSTAANVSAANESKASTGRPARKASTHWLASQPRSDSRVNGRRWATVCT